MLPSHSPEQAALAAELLAELAAYDAGLRLLLREWDARLYRTLSDQFDHMQLIASALPLLATSWTELLITRAELVHALWIVGGPSRIDAKVVACQAQHHAVVTEVMRKCRPYLPRVA